MSHQVPSATAVCPRADGRCKCPAQIVHGWQLNASEQPSTRFATAAEYIEAIEEIAKQHPRYRAALHADDRMLSFGLHYRWMWKSERWCRSYPFSECIKRSVVSLAQERRTGAKSICAEEARMFELFGERGPFIC